MVQQGSDVIVRTQGTDLDATFTVNSDNSLLLQQVDLTLPNRVAVTTVGLGCVFVQVSDGGGGDSAEADLWCA